MRQYAPEIWSASYEHEIKNDLQVALAQEGCDRRIFASSIGTPPCKFRYGTMQRKQEA